MDGFSYYNIFETKGLEYIIIIAFLALLIPFSILLNRKARIKRQLRQAMGTLTSGILKIPQGVFYCKNHTWAHLSKTGIANLGLDDLLLHFTGEVKLNYLKTAGDPITKGEVMTEIHHNGKMLKIYSPISGRIEDTNPLLAENPGVLNEDPYGTGWLYKVKPADWKAETSSYYLAESATDWSKKELQRFKDFLAVTMPKYDPGITLLALQDGGELRDNVMAELPGEVWMDFQHEFMNP
jgi:glycine cleavage system H protein